MKRLVSRYIQMTKANRKADGVNEDDLNEIKQDISSLRYVTQTKQGCAECLVTMTRAS